MKKDFIDSTSELINTASETVHKSIPETIKQTDGVLSTVVGFFNNVVLYPIKKANISFKYKLESFEQDMKKKIEKIPVENLQEPPTMLAGPLLEALKYTYDVDDLRELFENLLASAMDTSKVSSAHPSFVDAIRQMSPLDAKIMKELSRQGHLKCAEITFTITSTHQVYVNAMPHNFIVELLPLSDPFSISSCLDNLNRLGLIEITPLGIINEDYEIMKKHPYVLERAELIKSFKTEFEIVLSKHAVRLTDYGKNFKKACLIDS